MNEEMIDVDGQSVHIVRRPRMRSIRLRVQGDGSVTASASMSTPVCQIAEVVRDHAHWIARQHERLSASPMAQAAYASDEDKQAWRAIVEATVPLLLEMWEPVIGVRVKTLAYRNMKSRWGSCKPSTGRVCINTRLALYPAPCLEYVVVHELVHMLEPSHNARFHALMDEFLPDWRERRKLLR